MRASLLHPHDQTSPSLPQINCAFHPEQLLTNFCCSSNCLLPLCPSCITIHINEHISLKTNPQLENIHDSIRAFHFSLETYSQKLNVIYKHFVEAESKVDELREKVKLKFQNIRQQILETVEENFKRIEMSTIQKINDLNYVKTLGKYKDYAKKVILSLKNSERNFFAEESKVMRMIIKFQANQVPQQLDTFCRESELFLSVPNSNALSFTFRDNLMQLSSETLQNLFKLQLHEPKLNYEPQDLTPLIKQLYEKPCDKRQIKKSLFKFVSQRSTPIKHEEIVQEQENKNYETLDADRLKEFSELITSKHGVSFSRIRPELNEIADINERDFQFVPPKNFDSIVHSDAYSSVKESIVKATKDFNQTICRNSKLQSSIEPVRGRRGSLSKGKGITLMQPNHGVKQSRVHGRSFLKTDLDLNLLTTKTQVVPRKYR